MNPFDQNDISNICYLRKTYECINNISIWLPIDVNQMKYLIIHAVIITELYNATCTEIYIPIINVLKSIMSDYLKIKCIIVFLQCYSMPKNGNSENGYTLAVVLLPKLFLKKHKLIYF